jgi:hypothetical protein
LGGVDPDRVTQCIETVHTGKLEVGKFGRARKQMHMRFDEAWNKGAASRVDDLRRRAPQRLNGGAGPEGKDQSIPDSYRLRRRAALVHGQDTAVGDDEVGAAVCHRDSGLTAGHPRKFSADSLMKKCDYLFVFVNKGLPRWTTGGAPDRGQKRRSANPGFPEGGARGAAMWRPWR